jgi:hypothetical protein
MRVVSKSATASTRKPQSHPDNRIIIQPRKQKPIALQSPLPIWFLFLRSWQHRFGIATYMLIAGMLVVYSSNVYLQQRWGQEYRKLENLQRAERQLTTANEVLKNQLAKEAEQPATALVSPNPAAAIILPTSNLKSNSSFIKPNPPSKPTIDIPSGY